jgi:addiction module HigA family antidote
MSGAPTITEETAMLPTHRPPTHPGEMLLKEFLEPLGVSQVDAAKRMRIPFQRLNAIVKGRRVALVLRLFRKFLRKRPSKRPCSRIA